MSRSYRRAGYGTVPSGVAWASSSSLGIDPKITPRPVNQKTDPIQSVAAPKIEHILSLKVVADIRTPFGLVKVGRQADQTGVEIPDAPARYPLAEKVSRNERNHARIWSATLRGTRPDEEDDT